MGVALASLTCGVAPGAFGVREASAQGTPDAAKKAEAKKRLDAGTKALKSGDATAALREFTASNDASSTAASLLGLGDAHYALKQWPEAFEAYDDAVRGFGTSMPKKDRATADARMKELAGRTGTVSIRVNEADALVSVDGKEIGKSPVRALVRTLDGDRKITVTKEGFAPFEQTVKVRSGGKDVREVVDVALVRESKMGTLSVKEKSGQSMRVLVDGVDVGATPWTGEVTPGAHEVTGRGEKVAAPAVVAEVARGKKVDVELVGLTVVGHLEIKTSDGKGTILLDGKVMPNEGSFSGDVAPGPHVISVRRDGYQSYEKSIVLGEKQTVVENVTLTLVAGPAKEGDDDYRSFDGIYGGFALASQFMPTGARTELEYRCGQLGASSCDTSKPLGGGLMGYVGYAWDPLGIELLLGGFGDIANQKAVMTGTVDANTNPYLGQPPREETFKFVRFGGAGAVRFRVSVQSKRVRGSLAAGFGMAVRGLGMSREVKSTDGKNQVDPAFVPDLKTYVSPAVNVDASVQFRLSPTTSLALGCLAWLETAGKDAHTAPDYTRFIGNPSSSVPPEPLNTPSYTLASQTQFFLGPYLGLQFGP
ncbi:MAG: PEGA domain-containing protein [Polyangiaceae bacterium]